MGFTADVVCIFVFLAMVLVEGQRGVLLALVDFAGVLAGVVLVRALYVPLSAHLGSPSIAYLVLLFVALLLVIIGGVWLAKATKMQISGAEAAAGALLGICTAVILCFAFFDLLTIRYGSGAAILSKSLLRSQIYDLTGFRAFIEFARTFAGK